MKDIKKLSIVSIFTLGIVISVQNAFATPTALTVKLDGKAIPFPDAKPYVNEDNRTMIPVRFIAENLGCKVTWEETREIVIINKGDTRILLHIGDDTAIVNTKNSDTKKEFDTKAVLKDNRTMVPLRFVSETLGAGVAWDEANNTVIIRSDGTVEAVATPTPTPTPVATPSPTPSTSSNGVVLNFDVSVDPVCEQALQIPFYKSRVKSEDGSYSFSYGSINEKVKCEFNYLTKPRSFTIILKWASENDYTVVKQLLNIACPEIQDEVFQMIQERVGWQSTNYIGHVGDYSIDITHNSVGSIPREEQGVSVGIYKER